MKLTGLCYRAYPEFPILPFDPAIFGFTVDSSDREHERQCPCFSSGEYHLWWNWPYTAAREWCVPMTLFFITAGSPADLDALVVFQTESYPELIQHLLKAPYANPKPIIEAPAIDDQVEQLFEAMVSAGVLGMSETPVLMDALRLSVLDEDVATAAAQYLRAVEQQIGTPEALRLIHRACDVDAQRGSRWASTDRFDG